MTEILKYLKTVSESINENGKLKKREMFHLTLVCVTVSPPPLVISPEYIPVFLDPASILWYKSVALSHVQFSGFLLDSVSVANFSFMSVGLVWF